ncbi:MAG: PAS domain-containing protein [Salibacteraceae bacterium]
MGIFGRNKSKTGNASSSGGNPANAGAGSNPPTAPKQPPKPKLSNEEQNRLKDYPKVKKELTELEKKVAFQNSELQETDAFLRQTMEQLSNAEKERQFQRTELVEQDDYLRKMSEGYSKLQRKMEFQEREIQEQDDHVRQLTESYSELTRQQKFQENELQEQDDHVRRLTESYAALQKKEAFQSQELQEQDDHVRRLTESYANLQKKEAFQSQELQEQENHVRKLTEGFQAVVQEKEAQNQELQDQDDHVRRLTANYQEAFEQNQAKEQEIRDQENHVRQLTEDYSKALRKSEAQEQEIQDQEAHVRRLTSDYKSMEEQHQSQHQALEVERAKVISLNASLTEEKQAQDAGKQQLQDAQARLVQLETDFEAATTAKRSLTAQLDKQQSDLDRYNRQKEELLRLVQDRERELREQKQLLNESLPYLELSPKGVIQSANRAMERISGYTSQELSGRNERFTLQFKSDDQVRYDNLWSRVAEGFPQRGKFTLFTRDSEEIHVEAEYLPILDRQGRVSKIVKWIRETGDRFEHEETLAAQTRGLDDLLPVLQFDMDGRLQSMNSPMLQLLRIRSEDLKEKRFVELLMPEYRQSREWMSLWELLRTGEPVIHNMVLQSETGERVHLRCSLQPICDLRQEVVRVLLVGKELNALPVEPDDRETLQELLYYLKNFENSVEFDRALSGLKSEKEHLKRIQAELNRLFYVEREWQTEWKNWENEPEIRQEKRSLPRSNRYLDPDFSRRDRSQSFYSRLPN